MNAPLILLLIFAILIIFRPTFIIHQNRYGFATGNPNTGGNIDEADATIVTEQYEPFSTNEIIDMTFAADTSY